MFGGTQFNATMFDGTWGPQPARAVRSVFGSILGSGVDPASGTVTPSSRAAVGVISRSGPEPSRATVTPY